MRENQKATGIDFIKELFDGTTVPWLKLLIIKTLDEGLVEKENLSDIFDVFLKENALLESSKEEIKIEFPEELISSNSNNNSLVLKSLTHNEGANAIKDGESLPFGSNLTIIFGKNGSGKSSYYRVLTKISSKPHLNKILPNGIENQGVTNESYNATLNTSDIPHEITPQSSHNYLVEIFDHTFTPILVNSISHELEIEPLKLDVLTSLRSNLDVLDSLFREKITENETAQKRLKNTLESSLKEVEADIPKEQYNELQNQFDRGELEAKPEEFFSDNLVEENKQIQSLLSMLKGVKLSLTGIYKDDALQKLLDSIDSQIKKVESQKEIYKEILKYPHHEDSKWKAFMESGRNFLINSSAEDEITIPTECPFCEQSIKKDDESYNLIKAYMEFLADDVKMTLDVLQKKKQSLISNLSSLTKPLSSNLDNIPLVTTEELFHFWIYLDELKNSIFSAEKTVPNSNIGTLYLNFYSNLAEHLVELFKFRQKDNITQLKKKTDWLNLAKSVSFQGYKTKVSTVSKNAHEELITEPFVTSLRENLKELGSRHYNSIECSNSVIGGEVRLVKKLHGFNVKEVMSDGEQRLLSLAIFLTELEYRKSNRPIILDDAVTSLDFEFLEKIADKIVDLSTSRQIVVFTHHGYFYDYLSDKADSEAINLQIDIKKCQLKFDQEQAGVVRSERHNTLRALLQSGIKAINEVDGYRIDQAEGYLREAIEAFIDEKILCGKPFLIGRTNVKPGASTIKWDTLKNVLSNDSSLVDELKEFYGYLSNTGNHRTPRESDLQRLREIYTFLNNGS